MKCSNRRLNSLTSLIGVAAITLGMGSSMATASGLKSRQTGPDAILVDIDTDQPVFTQTDLPRGYHRISIAGLSDTTEPGQPSLPYRTFLVGLPEGTGITVSAHAVSTARLGAFRLAPFVSAPAMGFEQEAGLAEQTSRTEDSAAMADAEDPSFYSMVTDYPTHLAVVAGTGIFRDQRVAEVRVYPVQYTPADSEIIHHARIQVRIRFERLAAGAEESSAVPRVTRLDPEPARGPEHLRVFDSMLKSSLVNYEMIAPERAARRAAAPTGASAATETFDALSPQGMTLGAPGTVKATVTQDGLYQVTPAMLTAAGVNVSMVDPRTFHMTAGGVDVPILVDGESDGVFDPSDRVIFFGKGVAGDKYTRINVYYLKYNGVAGPRISSRSGLFTGAATTPAAFVTTAHAEQNPNYTSRLRPGITEAWYWGIQQRFNSVVGPPTDYPITVDRIDPAPHTITVRARMLGLTSGDHTPRLLLNGTQIVENTFSNQINFTQTATVSSSLLVNGVNTITMTMVNNGNPIDQIATDWFEIDYRRTYAVDSDRLLFDGEGLGTFHFSLSNLGSNNLVLMDVTAPGAPQQITIPAGQISAGPPFTASVEDILPSDRAYAISTRAALRQPDAVVFDVPSNLASAANGADYIIITDRSMLAAMQPLATHRASQGLRTALVATDDIYDEFNNGRSSPAAIKSFLTYAYLNWTAPAPAYVVLAGDGHVDYIGYLGTAAPNVIPPLLLPIGSFEIPSDNDFVAVAGGDPFPEMAIGRLPIRSAADATIVVNNIISYETNPPISTLNQRSLFVADNDNQIFQAILNNLKLFMPATMAGTNAYLPGGPPGDPNVPVPTTAEINATTDAIINGFNNGSLVATYFGHGNVTLWASELILEHNPNPPALHTLRLDANRLTNSGFQSFMVALNCTNGYFVDLIPAGAGHADYSLAEEWLRRSNRGAIASWAPAALGSVSDYDSISYELYSHIFMDHMTTLGPTVVAAMVDAINIFGISSENIRVMHFFGDPATRLALDSDLDGLTDYREMALGTGPADGDTDDDGLSDGAEVMVQNTNPLSPDSDGDFLFDGTERGVTAPVTGTNVGAGFFVADADPTTTTDPNDFDTDNGTAADGFEDLNHNGKIDPGETNPNNPADDPSCSGPLTGVTNLIVTRSGNDIVLSWDPAVTTPCVVYRVYAAPNRGLPKSSFGPFVYLRDVASPGFVHVGAAADANTYDYLVRVLHPQLGLGPLGAYGQ